MQYQGPASVAVLELRMWDGTVTSPIPNRPVQEGRYRNVGALDPDTKKKQVEPHSVENGHRNASRFKEQPRTCLLLMIGRDRWPTLRPHPHAKARKPMSQRQTIWLVKLMDAGEKTSLSLLFLFPLVFFSQPPSLNGFS